MKMLILRGIPGAGKNYHLGRLAPRPSVVVSADDYFMEAGEYRFDPKRLPDVHGACFRAAVLTAQTGVDLAVNNTNTTVAEIAPYVALGQAYSYAVTIRTLRISPGIAGLRNIHRVPLDTVVRMFDAQTKAERDFPPRWNHEVFVWQHAASAYAKD